MDASQLDPLRQINDDTKKQIDSRKRMTIAVRPNANAFFGGEFKNHGKYLK